MRNTHRVAAITGIVVVAITAGAGIASAQDDTQVCVAGPEQAVINAPALNCTDVSDVVDVDDTLNEVLDLGILSAADSDD